MRRLPARSAQSLCRMSCKSSCAAEAERSLRWAASIRGARPPQPSQVEVLSHDRRASSRGAATSKEVPTSQLRSAAIAERRVEAYSRWQAAIVSFGGAASMPHNKRLERARER